MRNTKQKELILEIINNSHSHPTAYDIYKLSRKTIPNISLGTVYRNISLLLENNQIKKIDTNDDICRYDNIKKRHPHFICNKCGTIIDIYDDYFINVKDIFGNIVNDYDIKFTGICKNCQRKEQNNNGTKRK